jgi:hypothetical protein
MVLAAFPALTFCHVVKTLRGRVDWQPVQVARLLA